MLISYEKKLILKEKLILPNGLYDNPKYRADQFNKFNLYYDNGIYIPKNLIVTMESADKPLNLVTIRRIIEAQLMPLMKGYASPE